MVSAVRHQAAHRARRGVRRLFRDELGRLNQALAAESEEVELVVAGRVVPLGEW